MNTSRVLSVLAGATSFALVLSADAAYTTGVMDDGIVTAYSADYSSRFVSNTNGDTKVGDEGSANRDTHRTIYKMALPTLGNGEVVDSVVFSYRYNGTDQLAGNQTPLAAVEVVAFDSTTSALTGSDWDNTASVIALSSNELVWGSTAGGTRTITGSALKQSVEQAYANGRDHLALRFQLAGALADDGDTSWEVYSLGTSESGEADRPALSVMTAVPEPAALGALALGSVAMLWRRRRA